MRKDIAQAVLLLVSNGYSVQGPAATVEAPKVASKPAPTPKAKPAPKAPASGLAARIAPHGYGPDGQPLAPFGFCADGVTPRKSNAGRKPKGAAPKADTPKAKPAPKATPKAAAPAPAAGGFSLDLGDILGAPTVQAAPTPAPTVQTPEPTAADALAELDLALGDL